MKVKVIQRHSGEGRFPTFKKGTKVIMDKAADAHFLHWYACTIEDVQTYVPELFVEEGCLTRDYNPTELVQEVGDILELHEIVYAWLYATNAEGMTGWIPAEAVVSL